MSGDTKQMATGSFECENSATLLLWPQQPQTADLGLVTQKLFGANGGPTHFMFVYPLICHPNYLYYFFV